MDFKLLKKYLNVQNLTICDKVWFVLIILYSYYLNIFLNKVIFEIAFIIKSLNKSK